MEGFAHAVVREDNLGEIGNAVALDDGAAMEGVARWKGEIGETGCE